MQLPCSSRCTPEMIPCSLRLPLTARLIYGNTSGAETWKVTSHHDGNFQPRFPGRRIPPVGGETEEEEEAAHSIINETECCIFIMLLPVSKSAFQPTATRSTADSFNRPPAEPLASGSVSAPRPQDTTWKIKRNEKEANEGHKRLEAPRACCLMLCMSNCSAGERSRNDMVI